MTLQRHPDTGLLLRGGTGLLTHDPSCCCDEAPSCPDLCLAGTTPPSVTIDISGLGNQTCLDCADINGEITHEFDVCLSDAFSIGIIYRSFAYSGTPVFCQTFGNPASNQWIRGNASFTFYHAPTGPYAAGDLVANYQIKIDPTGDAGRDQSWYWDNIVSAPGAIPRDCTALFNLADFGSPTYQDQGDQWCDPASTILLSYVIN